MNLEEMIEAEIENGYGDANAQAKVCQDIVLKAISTSNLNRNVTIKGGVVMRYKINNIRRATQDLDIDFIKYSLSDDSIDLFIQKLNCLDGIKIQRKGKIEELKKQDYHGKRVFIEISDSDGNIISSKLDLGVHNKLNINQEEYCFDIEFDEIMVFLETMGKKKIIISEMEISINNKCNLKCKECGFCIPNQIKPTLSDDILEEHFKCMKILKNNDVEINSLAILGGEPTLTPQRLEESVIMFSSLDNIKQIEIVSNGLNPKGLTKDTLKHIQKLSISVYTDDKKFIDAWEKFIDKKAPNVNIAFRIQKEWDINSGNIEVPDEKAQKLFENCWYKKHCATIERQRLFVCSLSAKAGKDHDGLLLTENTTKNEIEQYLHRTNFISHCKNCVAEMHLGKIQGGIQQDGVNLQKLIDNATNYLNSID